MYWYTVNNIFVVLGTCKRYLFIDIYRTHSRLEHGDLHELATLNLVNQLRISRSLAPEHPPFVVCSEISPHVPYSLV